MSETTVFSADSSLLAHLALHQLQQAGIDARIAGEYLQGGVGELAAFGNVRVVVSDQDADEAKAVIAEWEAAD